MNILWSDGEREYVRANAGVLTDGQMAANLTRITGRAISEQSARKQRQKLGILKRPGRGVCRLVEDQPVVMARPRGLGLHMKGAAE